MVNVDAAPLLIAAAYGLIVIGLVGVLIPALPGPLLIWLGALLFAWADGFERIGWGTLIVLGILALASWGIDLFLSTVMSRRAGTSWKAIGGAIVGGLLGAVFLSGVPVLGTLFGAVLGAAAGMWVIEYWDKGSAGAATTAVRAYVTSIIFSAALEMMFAVMMVAIFATQAFYFTN